MSKTCSNCAQTYEDIETNFYKHNLFKDGFNSKCKECCKEYYKNWYEGKKRSREMKRKQR